MKEKFGRQGEGALRAALAKCLSEQQGRGRPVNPAGVPDSMVKDLWGLLGQQLEGSAAEGVGGARVELVGVEVSGSDAAGEKVTWACSGASPGASSSSHEVPKRPSAVI